jgi:hypothetical protein
MHQILIVFNFTQASPVMIGGRQCFVEEKRTPGSRGQCNRTLHVYFFFRVIVSVALEHT